MALEFQASIIIPNYNGRKLLEQNLPSVIAAAKRARAEIIVVDDCSKDDSREWLSRNLEAPARGVFLEHNKGFSGAVMEGVLAARSDIVYLLNSDIRMEPDALEALIPHFADKQVFAAASLAFNGDGTKVASARSGISWKWGMPDVDRDSKNTPEGMRGGPTLFASGGHSAYRKSAFLELGGFNQLFHPFYYEDVDLCYNAWKRGMKVIFEPRSVVYHDHQGTIASVAKRNEIQKTLRRNRILFTWKNIDSAGMLASHAALLPIYSALTSLSSGATGLRALAAALKLRKNAIARRDAARSAGWILSDRDIFAALKKELRSTAPSVCYFGSFNLGYPRCDAIAEGLIKNGVAVTYCHSSKKGIIKTWPELTVKFLRTALRCRAILIGQGRHIDAPLARALGILFRKKVILDAFVSHYNTLVEDYELAAPGSLKAHAAALSDRIGVAFSSHVLLDTNLHIDYYCDKYGSNRRKFSRVLPGAQDRVYRPSPRPESGSRAFSVLFFGSFLKLHGVDTILRAADILSDRDDIRFDIVGDGHLRNEAEKLRGQLRMGNAEFHPITDFAGIARHIAACDICLGIFGDNKKAMMVIPNKVYQGAAMMKPVITGDTPGIRELFTDRENIYLVPPANPEALAAGILDLKNNSSLRDSIARKGYDLFLKTSTPEILVQPILKLL